MRRSNFQQSSEGQSALGPLIGVRRPKYEILHDVLGPFIDANPGEEDIFLFINLNSALRQFFSEYATARLTRGELNRNPRMLAAELMNVAGHYRNYVWKYYGRPTTIAFYHSTEKCAAKLAALPSYKETLYSKRMSGEGASGELAMLRGYVDFNIKVAKTVAEYTPNVYVVDTGRIDPEAWPWAIMEEGRVTGPAVVMSSWASDLQYALRDGVGVLRAAGDHSRLVTTEGVIHEALRESKNREELAERLRPNHLLYLLALAGDDGLCVDGIQKTGLAKAAKLIDKRIQQGGLPSDAPSLTTLIEDGGLPEDVHRVVSEAWNALVHRDYVAALGEHELAALDPQMVDRSSLGELERANSTYFQQTPLHLDMLFAGETGY